MADNQNTDEARAKSNLVGLNGLDIKKEHKERFFVETLSGSGTMFYGGSNKNWPKKAALGVKLFYYNLSPQPCSSFLALVPFLIWPESWVENGLNILNLFPGQDGVNRGLEKVCKKTRLQREHEKNEMRQVNKKGEKKTVS